MTHHHLQTTPKISIILASTSPRRKQLLELANIRFTTLSVDVDESTKDAEHPTDYIVRMIDAKATAACNRLINEPKALRCIDGDTEGSLLLGSLSSMLIITADTIGVLPDGQSVLLKPQDKADAVAMWSKMSGTTHEVWTAVQLTLIDTDGTIINKEVILEKTEVTFIQLTQRLMTDYWQSGEPQDKAGGYAIQGGAAAWVERINGSYTNVVGLPLSQTVATINRMINPS